MTLRQNLTEYPLGALSILPAVLIGLRSAPNTEQLLEALVAKLKVPRFFAAMEEDGTH